MANIDPYIKQIQEAEYGEEVRSSIINALEKVNGDNESYQDLKNEVIAAKDSVDEQVAAFDAKVTAAETAISNLQSATSTANTARTNLTNATNTANTAKTNLQNATTAANTAKTNVEAATSAANTAKSNAETAKTNLENTITSANTAKSNLQGVIDSANAIKATLDTTNQTASTAKTNLEAAITSANTSKTQLQEVIDNAGDVKADLSAIITQANTAKANLDASVNTANSVLQSLTSENSAAASNIEELRSENFNSQEILAGVADLRAYLGLTDDDILGVQVDYANKTVTRIAGAVNLTEGSDFDALSMYGGRRRCNVADDGTIVAWYGDTDFAEDGSMGQVMVYQPKFYYLVCPVVYDPIDTGIGYHLRKANYYVSEKSRAGFRLHPAFYDANGNEVDYVLVSAYEGSIWDADGGTDGTGAYLMNDEQVMSVAADKFCSIAGVKPASGLTQQLTRPNLETLAQNRGTEWHGDLIKIESAEQLLMMIELGTMNFQNKIGTGVGTITDNSSYNCSSLTGSTSALGNGTGQAAKTVNEIGGTETEYTANGKTAVSWRGKENPYNNIWKFVYGVNMWGNGSMGGGEPYICNDFNFAESKRTDNYEGAGFTVTNANGYISAMGYSTKCDWLFMASECLGNSSVPVGDYTYVTQNLNAYRIALLGGKWNYGATGGVLLESE
ncbi:MAG: hypothetical protein Q4C58_10350 [Eubacteriales bacterium]|nr:hypothetical protein [Eubacteriales bacterium]